MSRWAFDVCLWKRMSLSRTDRAFDYDSAVVIEVLRQRSTVAQAQPLNSPRYACGREQTPRCHPVTR